MHAHRLDFDTHHPRYSLSLIWLHLSSFWVSLSKFTDEYVNSCFAVNVLGWYFLLNIVYGDYNVGR